MASLGSLGREHAPADVTFDWFGTEIRCNSDISDTALLDFMSAAGEVDVEDEAKAAKFVKDFLRDCIHTDDFDTYWKLARQHRQSIEDHMRVAHTLIAEAGKGRTGSPADSATGQPAKEEESMASLLEQALPGRPDLQAGIGQELLQRQEAQQALRAV